MDIEIRNCAVPGTTSADVSRFFLSKIAPQSFDCVIVYLGNNEGSGGGAKGVYSPFRTRINELLSIRPQKKEFRPVLSPTRFQFNYEVRSPSIATTPAEFRANMRSIVRHAANSDASAIVINPIASAQFPAGLGAPNATYFAYLDDLDQLGYVDHNNPIDEPSRALALGLKEFASAQFDKAIDIWQPLATQNNVVGFIACNNVACARVRLQDFRAENTLKDLVGKYQSYDTLLLYNLGNLKRLQGDRGAMQTYLDLAYEKDASVYRIKQAYRDVLAGLKSFSGVRVIDLAAILRPRHFIDYCHPTDEGHSEIARVLESIIRVLAFPEERSATGRIGHSRYELVLPSPNYLMSPHDTIVDYYDIELPIDRTKIGDILQTVRGGASDVRVRDDIIVRSVENFLRTNSRHPIFTKNLDLVDAFLPMSHEIFSFPEFFLYRLLSNYYEVFERDRLGEALSAGAALKKVKFSAAEYKQLILRKNAESLDASLNLTRAYLDAIVQSLKKELMVRRDIYRVIIGHRIRTTMTWYTREAYRYGTQSRPSMLYARWEIEELIEALVVAIVIVMKRQETRDLAELDALLGSVLALLQVHEKWTEAYQNEDGAFSVEGYQAALENAEYTIRIRLGI